MFKRGTHDASIELAGATRGTPASWSAKPLLVAAAAFAVLASAALVVDFPIAGFIKENGLPGELRRLVRLGEFFAYGGTVAIIIATAATLDQRGWRVAIPLAVPSFGSGALADLLK